MFRCLNYIRLGFLLVLVFDGNKKPSFKRGKSVRGRVSSQQKDLIELAKILGIESRIAPGEAEYELAQMCRDGMIDAVLTVSPLLYSSLSSVPPADMYFFDVAIRTMSMRC